MTKITSLDLMPFYRTAVGVDRLFDRIIGQIEHTSSGNNYPPYNIIRTGEDTFEIEVAVAGFNDGDIDINVQEGQLVITGTQKEEEPIQGRTYQHQGISARRFVRTFNLADYVEVNSAQVKNGILTVELKRVIPDNMKPKRIAITYKS